MNETQTSHGGAAPARREDGSIKELIISMAIALAMALVAKVFVIEAFVIPTGSMAPTLLGQHMKFRSDQTGREWTVNPWFFDNLGNANPQGRTGQRGQGGRVPQVTDPMTITSVTPENTDQHTRLTDTGYNLEARAMPLRAGDRILVEKLIYEVFDPSRWDVVVFKNPQDPTINYIKRLIGLPNEQIWIADGDVFTRPSSAASTTGGWKIQRKPQRVQRSVWRPVFSSEFTPLDPVSGTTGVSWFQSPWKGEGWETGNNRAYRCETADPTTVRWDSENWPITDWEPYNDDRYQIGPRPVFPVSDVRMRAEIVPDASGLKVGMNIRARQHEFRADIGAGRAMIRMRPEGGEWKTLADGSAPALRAGRVTNVEFANVDQALELWVGGKRILHATYEWSPEERLAWTTGEQHGNDSMSDTALANAATYRYGGANISWDFEGSPVTVYRMGVDRDLFYQPTIYHGAGPTNRMPAFATHPRNLATTGKDQFFFLGDNSPASEDSRLWTKVDPEVAEQIDPTRGFVDRRMILGRAFFVYFPSPHIVEIGPLKLPVPDFGRMRWIK